MNSHSTIHVSGTTAWLLLWLLSMVALVGHLSACSRRQDDQPRRARVDMVKSTGTSSANNSAKEALADFCDAHFAAAAAPILALPVLAPQEGEPAAVAMSISDGQSVWLNVWATWCEPCIREIPLLLRWRDYLRREGLDLDLRFFSLDESDDDIKRFFAARPELAAIGTRRLANSDGLGSWVSRYGIDGANATLPIHLIASPGRRVRCLRAGGLSDENLPQVKAILRDR
ncbi:MAG: hypothetical protein V2A73_05965 [Pseudomonadota bacterium]